MKRNGVCLLTAGLAISALLVGLGGCSKNTGNMDQKKEIRIGVFLYKGDDAFISMLQESIQEEARKYEQETGVEVTLNILDAKGSQNTQCSQVERQLALGCDALCVNIVDRFAASVVIDKAMAANTPVIFFNREPVEEDLKRWEKLYYVGVDAKETAVLQGQILVDAYQKNPFSLDRNEDGRVSYVLLEGETSHQDSLIRTEWSIQTVKDGGVPLQKLTGGIANWERSQASALMEQWIETYGEQIEVVICNNDEMALGAIDAIERAGILDGAVKLVGIDGTPGGVEALKNGKLLGTVEADRRKYASAIFEIASALSGSGEKEKLPESPYCWCPQRVLVHE